MEGAGSIWQGQVGNGDKGGATGSGEGRQGLPTTAPQSFSKAEPTQRFTLRPSVPADPFQNQGGGLHICRAGQRVVQCGSTQSTPAPTRQQAARLAAAGRGSASMAWRRPRPHPCTIAPGMQTHRQVFQVCVFIEGTGFYRGAPRACGEKPAIGLEGSGPVGSWRWVSKTCAETDKDRGECRPRALRPHCRGCMLRATGRGRVRRGEVPGFT